MLQNQAKVKVLKNVLKQQLTAVLRGPRQKAVSITRHWSASIIDLTLVLLLPLQGSSVIRNKHGRQKFRGTQMKWACKGHCALQVLSEMSALRQKSWSLLSITGESSNRTSRRCSKTSALNPPVEARQSRSPTGPEPDWN